jgi:response regulator RpfG family c-di-GMP phosphodiesterase
MININFLLISTDEVRVQKLTEVIQLLYPENNIISTSSSHEAKDLLILNKPAIIFCEETLPDSDIFDFYHEIIDLNLRDKIYFIVISENDDFDHLQKYIDAEFDDYLIGHNRTQIIYNRIRLGTKILSMKLKIQHENLLLQKMSKQLEEDIDNILKLSTKFIQSRLPASSDMLQDIAKMSVWIADKFNQFSKQDIKDIEIASYFCQAGRLFLPDNLLKTPVMSNGRVNNQMMYQIPIVTKEIVSSIEKFKSVGEILYHIYENLDGSGIPDKIQAWQIPLGSRIIRAVLDFEENRSFNNLDPKTTIEKLKSRVNRIYDGRVINLLEEYVDTQDLTETDKRNDIALLLSELKANMVTSREIKANSGIKLIGENQTLSDKHIQMLVNHSSTDPILGYIYIKKDSIESIKFD